MDRRVENLGLTTGNVDSVDSVIVDGVIIDGNFAAVFVGDVCDIDFGFWFRLVVVSFRIPSLSCALSLCRRTPCRLFKES